MKTADKGDGIGQDQPTPEQVEAQEMNTANLDKATGELGTDQVQEKLDVEQAVGRHGHNPDPAEPGAYTIAGVTNNVPTPETDYKLREQARINAHVGHPEHPHTHKKGGN